MNGVILHIEDLIEYLDYRIAEKRNVIPVADINDEDAQDDLEEILHPRVHEDVQDVIESLHKRLEAREFRKSMIRNVARARRFYRSNTYGGYLRLLKHATYLYNPHYNEGAMAVRPSIRLGSQFQIQTLESSAGNSPSNRCIQCMTFDASSEDSDSTGSELASPMSESSGGDTPGDNESSGESDPMDNLEWVDDFDLPLLDEMPRLSGSPLNSETSEESDTTDNFAWMDIDLSFMDELPGPSDSPQEAFGTAELSQEQLDLFYTFNGIVLNAFDEPEIPSIEWDMNGGIDDEETDQI